MGVITTFDYPGAFRTVPQNVSSNNRVTGYYMENDGVAHAILGIPGSLVAFDAPTAGRGDRQGTYGIFNDAKDRVAGYVIDAQNVRRGFLRVR